MFFRQYYKPGLCLNMLVHTPDNLVCLFQVKQNNDELEGEIEDLQAT